MQLTTLAEIAKQLKDGEYRHILIVSGSADEIRESLRQHGRCHYVHVFTGDTAPGSHDRAILQSCPEGVFIASHEVVQSGFFGNYGPFFDCIVLAPVERLFDFESEQYRWITGSSDVKRVALLTEKAVPANFAETFCPRCKQPTQKSGHIFYEKGEWDGKYYDEEGEADEYQCQSCGATFAVLSF